MSKITGTDMLTWNFTFIRVYKYANMTTQKNAD